MGSSEVYEAYLILTGCQQFLSLFLICLQIFWVNLALEVNWLHSASHIISILLVVIHLTKLIKIGGPWLECSPTFQLLFIWLLLYL